MIYAATKPGLDGAVEERAIRSRSTIPEKNGEFSRTPANPALGQTAGKVAHDFNTILQAILGYASLTMEEVPRDSVSYRHMAKVISSAERGEKLVRRILEDTAPRKEETEPTALAGVVSEALDILFPDIPESIEVRLELDPNCPRVSAGSTESLQIVLNLLKNARQAIEETEGGILEVRLEEILIQEAATGPRPNLPPGRYARLTVSDTGHGMDEETLERIFEPGFTTKELGKGTGLGLSTVRDLVRKHDGEVRVDSAPGTGTAFHVFLRC